MLPNDHEYIVPNTAGANDLNVRFIKYYDVSMTETCFTCLCCSTGTLVINLYQSFQRNPEKSGFENIK